MSFLLRTQGFGAARSIAHLRPVQARMFGVSAARFLKESDRDPADPDANERHKQDQLQKQKEGRGHWKPELASDSEEAVSADRHEHTDHSEAGLKELQKKTQDHAEKKHKHGTSQDTGL